MKDIVILGGPNGAGKTTAAKELLPDTINITEFVNADEIARDLSPNNVDKAAIAAGRVMLKAMSDLAQSETSFAFETTCSGKTHLNFLERRKLEGWRLTLLYLWLPSVAAATARVQQRVREGGHAISPAIVARRYKAGVTNMVQSYIPLVDVAAIYDNSDAGRVLVAEKTPEAGFVIYDVGRWAAIESVLP